jgi:hypothetical protein
MARTSFKTSGARRSVPILLRGLRKMGTDPGWFETGSNNSRRTATTAAIVMFAGTIICWYGAAHCSAQPASGDESAKSAPAIGVPDQIKNLQQQLADLKKQIGEARGPRIVAAGTAVWTRPQWQANSTNTRVKLNPEIAAQLGKDYIVLLTNRSPVGGYPWFSCYWKIARDGFDVTLVDPTIAGGSSSSYDNNNTSYLVDWAVVKK